MTYQELLDITNNISFDKVFEAEYTTGNGWTNAHWSTQASFIQFLTNCLGRNVAIRLSEKINMSTYTHHAFSIVDGKVTKTN